jgi:hypothetical protein
MGHLIDAFSGLVWGARNFHAKGGAHWVRLAHCLAIREYFSSEDILMHLLDVWTAGYALPADTTTWSGKRARQGWVRNGLWFISIREWHGEDGVRLFLFKAISTLFQFLHVLFRPESLHGGCAPLVLIDGQFFLGRYPLQSQFPWVEFSVDSHFETWKV